MSDVETGRNEPQADTISRFCEALEISYEDVEALRHPNLDRVQEHLIHVDICAVPGFTGREDLLAGIDAALWQQGGTAALTNSEAHAAAVKGLGGVGKSVLAREYAWRARGRYHGVWWVRAETEQTLIDDLIDLGSRLIPNLKEVRERDRALHLALDAIAGAGGEKPWLIVYDNVEKPGALRLLTPKTSTHILITSRWPRWQGHAQELPVDVFPEDVAVDFLLAERPHETRETAGRLAVALGFLPLALSHARAYCAETNLSFDDYTRRLSELIREVPEDAEYPASVFATFSLAIAKAAKACPEAEKLMAIAAFLAPERIPLDIITNDVMSEAQRDRAVQALYRLSLIEHGRTETGGRAITVHRLVQEVVRGCLGELRPEAQRMVLRLMHRAFGIVRVREHLYRPYLTSLLPHAIAVLSLTSALGDELDAGGLCRLVDFYFDTHGDYVAALPYSQRALAIAEAVFGPDHPDTGDRLNNLAKLYRSQGRYSEAEALYARSLAIAEAALGPEHPTTGIQVNNLALLYDSQGRHNEAETLYRRALAISAVALGPDHPQTGAILNNLGEVCRSQGRSWEAEALFVRALAIAEAVLGPNHHSTSIRLNNLAGLYQSQGRFEEAETLYIRALANSEAILEPGHPIIGVNLNNLAGLYLHEGRLEDAEPLFVRALTIAEMAFGPEHPTTAIRLNNLANLCEHQGRHREAEPLYARALAIFEKQLGHDHPSTQSVRANYQRLRQAFSNGL